MVEALQFCIERKIANREISKDIYERAYKALELKAAQNKRTVEISTVLLIFMLFPLDKQYLVSTISSGLLCILPLNSIPIIRIICLF